jgi:hypothetical protein
MARCFTRMPQDGSGIRRVRRGERGAGDRYSEASDRRVCRAVRTTVVQQHGNFSHPHLCVNDPSVKKNISTVVLPPSTFVRKALQHPLKLITFVKLMLIWPKGPKSISDLTQTLTTGLRHTCDKRPNMLFCVCSTMRQSAHTRQH